MEALWLIRVLTTPHLRPALNFAIYGILGTLVITLFNFFKPTESKGRESFYFIALTFLVGVTILLNHDFYLAAGIPVEYPYLGIKVLALVLAWAAPGPSLSSWACYGLLLLTPLGQSWYWTPEERAHFGDFEPWITLIFIALSSLLWLSRCKLQQSFHRVLWLEGRALSAERLAHLLLSVRHLQNSSLQLIEGQTALIEIDHPDLHQRTRAIQNAINRIVRLTSALEVYDDQTKWVDFVPPKNFMEFELRLQEFTNDGKLPPPKID